MTADHKRKLLDAFMKAPFVILSLVFAFVIARMLWQLVVESPRPFITIAMLAFMCWVAAAVLYWRTRN